MTVQSATPRPDHPEHEARVIEWPSAEALLPETDSAGPAATSRVTEDRRSPGGCATRWRLRHRGW